MLQFTPVHPCNICLLQDFPPIKPVKRLLLINTKQTKNPSMGKWDGFDFPHSPRLRHQKTESNDEVKLLLQPLKSNPAAPSQWINLPALNNKQPSAFPNRSLLNYLPSAKCQSKSKSKLENTKSPCNDFALKIEFEIWDFGNCKFTSIGKQMQT